ncbi:MAG: lipoate--protein ligase family protein [Candidatus Eremiobacteraeota bacterium]|nr:lipoate--protein ligase family protein [Candidatus Eremiobacteraeota bacterium]
MKLRVIYSPGRNAFENMAYDEALMTGVRHGLPITMRLYSWRPPGFSLGYFQPYSDVDLEACKKMGIDIVRRPTGGRGILHDQELTYSVIMPIPAGKEGSLLNTFKYINKGLLAGLSLLGIDAALVPRSSGSMARRATGTAACFSSPSSYEVQVNGKKLLGSAQFRKDGILAQHGSLPIKLDREKLFACIIHDSNQQKEENIRSAYEHMTCIEEILGKPVSWKKVADALVQGVSREWNLNIEICEPEDFEEELMKKLLKIKYSNPDWSKRR